MVNHPDLLQDPLASELRISNGAIYEPCLTGHILKQSVERSLRD